MIEDEESATDIKTRRKFASAIKEFTANREHYCHPKFPGSRDDTCAIPGSDHQCQR